MKEVIAVLFVDKQVKIVYKFEKMFYSIANLKQLGQELLEQENRYKDTQNLIYDVYINHDNSC